MGHPCLVGIYELIIGAHHLIAPQVRAMRWCLEAPGMRIAAAGTPLS